MVSQMSPIIPFGEWLPDTPDYGNSGSITVNGVLVQGDYYIPIGGFSAISDALAGIISFFSCRDTSGSVHIFAGTVSALYKLSGSTWNDVSKVGGYTTPSDGYWIFTIYGNRVLATNGIDNPQSYVIGSSSIFANLAGSPPVSQGVFVLNNFVGVYGIDSNPQRIQWSALDDPTDWTPSAATQSDFNDILGTGGKVQAVIASQNVAIIIMEKQIWRMDYVGGDIIFQFTLVEDKRGTISPRSVAADGLEVFYLGEDGFYGFNGTVSQPIGYGKVDKYFYGRQDGNFISTRVVATSDPSTKTVLWGYQAGSTDGTITNLLIFNRTDRKWTEIDQDLLCVEQGLTMGVTMEQLATLYGTMENVPFNLDSPVWQGGRYVLAGISSTGQLGYFGGANMDATLITTETQLTTGRMSKIEAIIPVTDAANVTVSLGYRNLQSGTVTYTDPQTPYPGTGECNFNNESRYHRAKVQITGDWLLAQGVQVRATPGGI